MGDADDDIREIFRPRGDGAIPIADQLTEMGYKEIAEGEELRPGYYEYCSGEDENGNDTSSVRFIELPEHKGLAAKLDAREGPDFEEDELSGPDF
jgi:hypothetical protein